MTGQAAFICLAGKSSNIHDRKKPGRIIHNRCNSPCIQNNGVSDSGLHDIAPRAVRNHAGFFAALIRSRIIHRPLPTHPDGLILMNRKAWLLIAICLTFLSGCVSSHKPETSKPALHTQPVAKPPVRSVTSADGLVKGEIVGIPAPASKFSQLQIGMTLEQVEHLIGMPDKSDSRITGKQYQPFYFGGDTQRTEAYYKGEGHLTFSNTRPDSAPDTLIRITVYPGAAANQ